MVHPFAFAVVLCFSSAHAQSERDSIVGSGVSSGVSVEQTNEQRDGDVTGRPKQQNLLSNFLSDHGDIWSSPFRMDWEDAALWGGITATTALLITVDEPIYRSFRDFRNDHTWVKTVSPVASQFGEFYVPYGIAALYCLKGLAFDDDDALDTGLLAAQAMVHSGIVVQVMKHIFGRSRPFVFNGDDNWYGPRVFFTRYVNGGFSPYDSFPSGHTITAFSLATVLAERERPWVGATAYALAGLCGLSRLTENDHWLSDVVMGAALGVGIGKLVVNNHNKRLAIYPSVGARSAGVTILVSY